MGQGNILIHAPTPPIPDSNTHRLSWETQIPSTNGPSSLSGPVQESVPLRADLAADVHTHAAVCPGSGSLLAGMFTLWTQRGRLRNPIWRVWIWRPCNLEMIFRRTRVQSVDYPVLKPPPGTHPVSNSLLANNLTIINGILCNNDLFQVVTSVLLKWNFLPPSMLKLLHLEGEWLFRGRFIIQGW